MTPPTCPSGKMAYPAPKWAEKVAKHHNRNSRFRVRYYLCPDCGWYHLGRGQRPNIKPKRKVVIDE